MVIKREQKERDREELLKDLAETIEEESEEE